MRLVETRHFLFLHLIGQLVGDFMFIVAQLFIARSTYILKSMIGYEYLTGELKK